MKRKHIIVLFFLASLLIASCTKMDKLFNNGEPVTEYRSLGYPFKVISIHNNVNVKLIRDNHPHLELTCPKNLIERITTEIEADTLVIKNKNEYNWLRSYDYDIDLTIYYDSINRIQFASIGQLTSLDSIKGIRTKNFDSITIDNDTVYSYPKTFVLNIKEGSGDIDLTFDCQVLKTVFSNGTSKVTLHGVVGYVEHYMRSYGTIHAENLNTNIVKVHSQSTNDIYVWARNELEAHLNSIGNVYYKGNPWIVQECTGEGHVIKLE